MDSLPGHYEFDPSSSGDSDTSFSPALMDHLEQVAQLSADLSSDEDPDWAPDNAAMPDSADDALIGIENDDDDDDEEDEEEAGEAADGGETRAGGTGAGQADRGALQIGYDRQSCTQPHSSDRTH